MNKNYFRNTNKDVTVYQNTIIKKCAYILFGIHKDKFIELGGKMIDDSSSYYIEKKYDGTPTGEVCAVLALSKNDIITLFKDIKEKYSGNKNREGRNINQENSYKYDDEKKYFHNNMFANLSVKDKSILEIIKEFNLFKNIDKIENINTKNIESVIKHFYKNILDFEDEYLFILNIEPRGQTRRELRFYPNPNLCIPGGNMEYKDESSFENCALREFQEETGIKVKEYLLIDNYNIEIIKKYKNMNKHRESFSFPTTNYFKRFDFNDYSRNVKNDKKYFLAKIIS
jgi:hypothetical protein